MGFLVAVAAPPISPVHAASASSLDGRVPGQSALELLEPAGNLVAECCVALLVVDLAAEQAAALGGGSGGAGSVLVSHFGVGAV